MIARKEIEQPIREMHQTTVVNYLFAGRAGNVEDKIAEPFPIHPESIGLQLLPLGPIASYHGAVRVESLGEVLDQRVKEALTGLRRGPFQDGAQRGILIQVQQR